jgi:UDP-glucuronate decarboxylase
MKTALVTGASGFLGSHLVDRLLSMDYNVIGIDNYYSSDGSNLDHLKNNYNFKFLIHNICHPIDMKMDEIYNLACPASPIHYQRNPIKTVVTNVYGVINMLDLAKRNDAKIMQASTSEIYGNPLQHPQKESYFGNVNTTGIRSCYDEGKRVAETLFTDYHRQYGVDIRIARIFNTYGPRMHADDGRVVSNFIVQALTGQNITIYGNGTQTRSFCYVDDLIDSFILLMNGDICTPVNLGNPVEFNMIELAEFVLTLTKSKSKIVFKPLPQDDPSMRKPNISLAKEKLGWEPKVPLSIGLDKTISYFRKII